MGALEVAMSKAEAEKVTLSIQYTLKAVASSWSKAVDLMEQAEAGGAWKALGYASWTAYWSAEFGDILRGISRDDRRPVVAKMRELGMSTRAIGKVVGVSKDTVQRDLAEAGVSSDTPAPPVTGEDGKTYRKLRLLPSGKPDAASTEDMGMAVPPVTKRKPPAVFVGDPTLIAGIRRDLDTLADRISQLDDDGVQEFRRTYADELAAIVRIARGMVE
ncbi:hypothetical protein [Nocardioides panzhihuensis]|uniref:Uncharacterized protein n=1 Tax=Nocardioides panzhihuensis TaxID=860243 RepID=A0A7Z0DNM1_9ACTN|nr:hypothetical protein [Nocardioides panzhihuensis]NYI78705.1 hypothetical protein [Nocardioides panzhihuensis]